MCVCCAKAGKTALHVAAMHGHTDIVDLILQNAVDVDHTDRVSSVKPKFHLARHITSRHESTRSTCRARRDERVEPCCSTSSTQPKCIGSTRRTCRVVSRRDVT